ncbi:MAG: Uma2 family endonuclease [Bryobacteraceae bacterium]
MQVLVTEEAVLDLEDMNDEEFFDFCARNSELRIERDSGGRVTIMSGTGGRTGNRNIELSTQIQLWARRDGRGVAFDSSTLFRLPNGAMRSPDASWVTRRRLAGLTETQKERYQPLCPEFVVELTSPSDRLTDVKQKMIEWIENGCGLGWILDTRNRRAHVYRSSGVEILDKPSQLSGEGPIAGFTLDLAGIWDPGW